MKRTAYFFIVLFSVFTGTLRAQNNVSVLSRQIDEYFTALNRIKKFNGCLYVQVNGKSVLKKAYTLTPAPTSMQVTDNSQFDIHSVSKLMANALLVQLEQQGKIQLDTPLNTYIPDFPSGDKITIRQLMEHRSGLPRELTDTIKQRIKLKPEAIITAIKKEKLEFEPGSDARYSNLGYEVIYYLIGKVTQKPFAQYLQETVFKPLQMNASGAHFYSHTKPKNLAANHQLKDNKITRVPNIMESEFATARIYSTTSDLIRYLNALNQEPYKTALANSKGVIEKNGGSDGIRAQIYTNTALQYSFVLLSNYDEIPFQQTVTDLVNILDGKPYVVPKAINRKAIPLSADVLNQYIGKYDFAEANHTELEFRTENGQLCIYQDNEKQMTLFAESERVFFEDPKSAESFEFQAVENGFMVLWDYKGIRFKGIKK